MKNLNPEPRYDLWLLIGFSWLIVIVYVSLWVLVKLVDLFWWTYDRIHK